MKLLFSLALLSGCAGDDTSGGTRLRLALNWFPEPEFGGFYEGALSGIYKDAGFDVEIVPGGPGAPTLELLSAGQAEVAITSADDLLLKRQRGVVAVAVWTGFQVTPAGLMVHAPGPVSFAEIQSGTAAIEVGSPMWTWIWKKNGWDGKVQAVPYSGGVGPFLADPNLMQQAYITSEPCLVRAQNVEIEFLRVADAGWNPYGTVVALPEPMPEWAGRFVEATQKAWRSYLEDPTRANAEISRLNDQMRPELMRCITEAQRPFLEGTDGIGAMRAERWDATAGALVELALLPAGSTASGAWRAVSAP